MVLHTSMAAHSGRQIWQTSNFLHWNGTGLLLLHWFACDYRAVGDDPNVVPFWHVLFNQDSGWLHLSDRAHAEESLDSSDHSLEHPRGRNLCCRNSLLLEN